MPSPKKTPCYAAPTPTSPLVPHLIERRAPGPHDVLIETLYCGICHSDIHLARNEWGTSHFPVVPGHEIIGRVTAMGAQVTRFQIGDLAGVGCILDSCRSCASCLAQEEQFCEKGPAWSDNGTEMDRITPTYGGYSALVVADERFAFKIPAGLDPATAAPILCAGITAYSPLRQWGVGPQTRIAILGLGGLGHMAVKLAASMGAEVTVLSTSRRKEADARRLGAHEFVDLSQAPDVTKLAGRFHLLLDTVSARHDCNPYLSMVRSRGTLVMVGLPPEDMPVSAMTLTYGNRRLAGSTIGGIAETQEALDYCAANRCLPEVEVIPIQQVNAAYERVIKGDVRYRFVIDLASLRSS